MTEEDNKPITIAAAGRLLENKLECINEKMANKLEDVKSELLRKTKEDIINKNETTLKLELNKFKDEPLQKNGQ